MKKIAIIISFIAILLAVSCIIITNKRYSEPAQPIQTEQTVPKVQIKTVTPKVEPKEESKLLDENDMPKSDVNVPEIG